MSDEERRNDGDVEQRKHAGQQSQKAAENQDETQQPGAALETPRGVSPENQDRTGAGIIDRPTIADPEVVEVRKGLFGNSATDTSGFGELRRPIVRPKAAVPPYGSWFDEAVEIINEAVPGAIRTVRVDDHDGLTLLVNPASMLDLAWVLRDDARLRFELCPSVSGVHFPADAGNELHVVYQLLSMTHKRRMRVETAVPDANPHLPSVVPVYPGTDWHERETWDLFGVIFDGHPALTRIMMPDDWPGHPQRKDYPLGGVPVEYKGATIEPPDERRSYSK